LQAQQAHDVGAVGVEVLPFSRAVEPNGRTVASLPFVAHVTEECAVRVLTDRVPEMKSETDVSEFGRGWAKSIQREASHDHKAAASVEVVRNSLDGAGKAEEREHVRA
jgi:hypothetical protein